MEQDSEYEEMLEARRERSNKISKLMGNYLLKGYKMLSTTCNKCQTILLQDRQGEDYCIGCVEIDNIEEETNQQENLKLAVELSSQKNEALGSATSRDSSTDDQSIRNVYIQIDYLNNMFNRASGNTRQEIIEQLKSCYETLSLIPRR